MDSTVQIDPEMTMDLNVTTSPSQLQEVTLGANATLQELQKTSPMRGKSVKEYDETLSSLQKDNFNLKLRIYFLEEKMGSTYRSDDMVQAIKKNIEFKVEIEELRRSQEEKQDLLCQAVKAIELEEQEHQKELAKKDQIFAELLERTDALQAEVEALAEVNESLMRRNPIGGTGDSKKEMSQTEIKELNLHIEDLEQQLVLEREHNAILEDQQQKSQCLELRCKNLEEELAQKTAKINAIVAEVEEKSHTISSYNLRLRTLQDALETKQNDIDFKEEEIQQRNTLLEEKNAELRDLKRQLDENQKELRQIENLKNAVMQRDNNIADLDGKLVKCKTIIKNLESKFESMSHENKRNQDELVAMREQRKRNADSELLPKRPKSSGRGSPPRSPPETITQLKEDLYEKTQTVNQLRTEQNRCLGVVRNCVARIKHLEEDLKVSKENGDKVTRQLEELQLKDMRNTLVETFGEKVSMRTSIASADKENVFEEINDSKMTDDKADSVLEYKKQIQSLTETLQVKEEKLAALESQCEKATSDINLKDNRIVELEGEVEELKQGLNSANKKLSELQTEKDETDLSITNLEQKDKKIEQLETEVRKHKINLQGIVNTELWEKNREIEKLQIKLSDRLKVKEQEIMQLEKEMLSKDLHLKILKDKINELGIHVNLPSILVAERDLSSGQPQELNVLQTQLKVSTEQCKHLNILVEELRQQLRNTPERESDSNIAELKAELDSLRLDYGKSEKYRIEMMNLCSLLTNRLDELAHFLDSLLKHKSVLGVLGNKQCSVIKQAIDQSLDLSKSFSISMMNDEASLTQLSSISGILNMTQNTENISFLENDSVANVSLTYNSHLSRQQGEATNTKNVIMQQTEIINVLRSQIETLKKEIEVRDMELCKLVQERPSSEAQKSVHDDNEFIDMLMDLQSSPQKLKESEILSPGKIVKNLLTEKCSASDNQSESDAWSEPDRDVSQARIGLITVKSAKSGSGEDSSTEESGASHKMSHWPTMGQLQQFLSSLEEKEKQVLTFKCWAVDMDNKHKKEKLTMCEDMKKLREDKDEAVRALAEAENRIKDLQLVVDETNKKLEHLQGSDHSLKLAEAEIVQLKAHIDDLDKAIELKETNFHSKLSELESQWLTKMEIVEQNCREKILQINDAMDRLRKQYDEDYVQKTVLIKHVAELQTVKDLLEQIEAKLKNAEDAKTKLLESEKNARDKLIAMKRELNESALCASQAVLDRTKVYNEKLKVEQELRKLEMRENEKTKELDVKDRHVKTLQRQISLMETNKANLQLKLSEQKSTNAELHNRLAKEQYGGGDAWPKSSPTSPIKITEVYSNFCNYGKHSLGGHFNRQRSDVSGYVSEGHLTDDNEVFHHTAPEGCQWFSQITVNTPVEVVDSRNAANSSPDLGIESDQGRLSSLETNVATTTRPLLQTLELTASMNNLLSADNLSHGHYCNVLSHKSLEKQNADLQKTVSKLENNLKKTYDKLSIINQNKKQVEKAVCKQIHKTSIVLRQARANLDSGSENEVRK